MPKRGSSRPVSVRMATDTLTMASRKTTSAIPWETWQRSHLLESAWLVNRFSMIFNVKSINTVDNAGMVMVKLENIADDLKDIKRESRENREEMKTLRERVVIVEQSLKSYHKRLDGEQHSDR